MWIAIDGIYINSFGDKGISIGESSVVTINNVNIINGEIAVSVKDKSIISSSRCKKAIRIASKLIKNQGRMLVRKSGTESKIRIMGESNNKVLLSKCINIVKRSIK